MRWAGAALVCALLLWLVAARFTVLEPYRRFERADGRYTVEVLREKPMWAVLPGQASDAPGQARLLDSQGRLLQQQQLEMVQLVADVQWHADRVVLPLVAEWPTP